MPQVLAVKRPRAAAPPRLAPAEIGEVEVAFQSRDPASSWVGYARLEGGRLALFFRDGGDPVLTLARNGAGAIVLSDRHGSVVASAHSLTVLLQWLRKRGPDRAGATSGTG